MNNFIKIALALLILSFLINLWQLFAQGEKSHETGTYTAYNIWYENPKKIYSINYKKGNLIPAGSEVDNLKLDFMQKSLEFRVVEFNQVYKILFESKYFPNLDLWKFKDLTLTENNLDQLTKDMTSIDIDGIKNARIIKGMSKAAVLIAYGYPPTHLTTTLDMNIWIYWRSRWAKNLVEFDEQGKTLMDLEWR